MAHTVSDANISDILERLNDVDGQHPFDATTFADWATEAGDKLTVKRGNESYTGTVHTSRMVWRGTPQTTLSSTGRQERDAVNKVSRKKYGSAASLNNTMKTYDAIITSYNEMTAGLILASSAASLYVQNAYTQMKAGLDLTSSSAALYVQNAYTQMKSGLDLTSSSAALYVQNAYTQMKAGLDLTSSSAALYVQNAYTQMKAGLDLTTSSAALYVQNMYTQMKSGLDLSTSSAALYVQNMYTQMKSGLDLSTSSAALYVQNMYTQMKSGLDLSTSSAALYVQNMYTQMKSGLDLSTSSAALYVQNMYTQMKSGLDLSTSSAALYVQNMYTQMKSGLDLSTSSAALYVQNMYTQMKSGLDLTSSSAALYARSLYDQMQSGLELSSSAARLYVNGKTSQAAIILAINGSGGSSATISADKVSIDGSTSLSGQFTVDSGSLIVNNNIYAGLGGSNYIQGKTLKLVGASSSQGADVQTLTAGDISGMVVKAEVAGNTLKLWTHGADLAGNPTWSFSKATSLNPEWSGNKITVTAQQNGENVGTPWIERIYPKINGSLPPDASFTAEAGTYDSSTFVRRGDAIVARLELDTSGSQQYVKAVTGEGLSKVEFAKIPVTGSITSVTQDGAWSNNVYNVTAKDQNGTTVSTFPYDPPLRLYGQSASISAEIYSTDSGGNITVQKSVPATLVLMGSGTSARVDVNENASGTGTVYATLPVGTLYTSGRQAATLADSWGASNGVHTVYNAFNSDNKLVTTISSVCEAESGTYYIKTKSIKTGEQSASDRLKKTVSLDSGTLSNGSRTITFKFNGSATGLTYTCSDYNTGYSAGEPTDVTLGTKITGTVWNVSVTRGDNTSFADTLDMSNVYTDAQNGVNVVQGDWNTISETTTGRANCTFSPSVGTGSSKSIYITNGYRGGNDDGYCVLTTSASNSASGSASEIKAIKLQMNADSWNNNKCVVSLKSGPSLTSLLCTFTVDANSIYTNGYNNGKPTDITLGTKISGTTWNVSATRGDGTAYADTLDLNSVYTDARSGYYTKAQYDTNYTTGYNDGKPTDVTLSTKVSGTTWNVGVTRGDGTVFADTLNLSSVYTDARDGYYTRIAKSWNSSGKVTITRTNSTGDGTGTSFELTIGTSVGGWSSGTNTISVTCDGATRKTATVSVPSVDSSNSSWTNTSGRKYKANLSIGGVTRSSSEKDFAVSGWGGTWKSDYFWYDSSDNSNKVTVYPIATFADGNNQNLSGITVNIQYIADLAYQNGLNAGGATVDSWAGTWQNDYFWYDSADNSNKVTAYPILHYTNGTTQNMSGITVNIQSIADLAYANGKNDGITAGITAYRSNASGFWKKPQDNNGVCTIPNSANNYAETWFTMTSIGLTRSVTYKDSNGSYEYYGKLYYYDNSAGVYRAASDSNHYWYYSSRNKSGSFTAWYP